MSLLTATSVRVRSAGAGALTAAGYLLLVLAAAVAPGLFTDRDPLAARPADRLLPPGSGHPFGTDELGRDLFARVVHGTALSLEAAAIACAIALVLGTALGLLSGALGGRVDELLMRATDVLLAIPSLLLSLALVTALGFGTVKAAVAVGVTSVAGFARIMRAQVLRVRAAPYVEAARAAGSRWPAVLLGHVLPNAWGPVRGFAALQFATSLLSVSSLGFLGYGAAPPAPEWGSLVAAGQNWFASAWWLSTLPGLTVAATVLAVNRLAAALPDAERP
ncbi:ABC transporter permease [Kitasatospora sp. NPDC001540]|uniref:ABC transporter permease n=1 Tax=Kitasatospora sp. NPDC001540 TaxID=3364014 RepID=UPI0036C0478D